MIEISVDTRRAVVTNKEILTSGSAGIQVKFTLSEDWTGLSKLAVFRTGEDGESIDVVLDNNLNCVVPAEALETADEVLFIGVYGSDGNGTVIIPTIWAAAGVIRPGTEPNTPAEAEPTPEIWAQILSVAQEAETTATGAMNYVEQAVSDLGTLEDRVSDNEEDRVAAEQARASAEDNRAEAETARITNEDSRINAESNRNTAEVARSMAETARADAEAARVTAEQGRVTAENERAAAEAIREEKYAEYVETVSDYADDAEASAEAARTSMINAQSASASASQSATRANNSATIAASKANEASSWADTALNAAGNAADSQSAAAQSATAAAASQTEAETAQTAAEAAQSAAEDAQDAAETAQTAAEAAASSISGKSEQIDQNTSDIGDLSRQLSDLEDTVSTTQIINTASGAIASFDDGADGQPIRKLVAQIEPVQDLHGYANPWPAGGGKNKLKPVVKTVGIISEKADGTIVINGTSTGATWLENGTTGPQNAINLSAGTYTISGGLSEAIQLYGIYSYDDFVTRSEWTHDSGSGATFTLTADAKFYLQCQVLAGTYNNQIIYPQFESGSTKTSWSPYSNICPISGHTGAEIEQMGKNLYHGTNATDYTVIYGGKNNAIAPVNENYFFKPGTYRISFELDGYVSNPSMFFSYKVNGVWSNPTNRGQVTTFTFTVPENCEHFEIWGYGGSYTGFKNVQIELGSAAATDYEPYQGNQISVDWEDEAGTVYGGTLTINPDRTGQLVVDRVKVNLSFGLPTRQELDRWIVGAYLDNPLSTLIGKQWTLSEEPLKNLFLVSNLPIIKESLLTSADRCSVSFYGHATGVEVRPRFLVSDYTAEQAKAIADAMELVYPINPITYQLTESEISGILSTLYGTNSIWSSTGDTEVTYPADTKLYIDGKIAEAIAALNA